MPIIITKFGYTHIHLCNEGIWYQKQVHKLVAEMFVKNDDPVHKTEVRHINGKKWDNDFRNLEWVSPENNTDFSQAKENASSNVSGKEWHFVTTACCPWKQRSPAEIRWRKHKEEVRPRARRTRTTQRYGSRERRQI